MPYWVYVIELGTEALSANDRRGLGRGAVYVGYTGKTPDARLVQHQTLVKPGRIFKRMTDPSMSVLRMDLALYAGPYETPQEAKRNERRMHNRLKSDGYRVFGNLNRKRKAKPATG